MEFYNDKILDLIEVIGLSPKMVSEIAYETGFTKRMPKKITATSFLNVVCVESIKGSPSYNHIASRLDSSCGEFSTKQAVWKRTNNECVLFFQAILLQIIAEKIKKVEIDVSNVKNHYKRVLVQDSTIIRLPFQLFDKFSGVKNSHASVCNARIQGVYDLVSNRFIDFSIDSYSKNDLKAAPELKIEEGDLNLRDRGYWIIDEVRRHKEAKADCIYRYKHKTIFLNADTREEIDLLKLLKKKKILDTYVRFNDKKETLVRIVAMPVSAKISNKRRMDAKKEAKKGNLSKEFLELLGWTIYVTTIPKERADFEVLFELYSLRWRIEIIFKTWKSSLSFGNIHQVSERQLWIMVIARLIMIVLATQHLFAGYCSRIYEKYNRELSLLKFVKYVQGNIENIPLLFENLILDIKQESHADRAILRYCAYDKRNRSNFIKKFISVFA